MRRVNALLAWQKFPLPYYGIGESARASTKEIFTPSSCLATLTPRDFDIVRLDAQPLSNKEIGARLGITARTAGTHLANIFDKLDLRERTALGDLAREQGLHRFT